MLSIEDGVLIKYEEKLKQEIIDGEYEGVDLDKFTMDDIIRLGISKFGHRKLLQENIEKLKQINGNKQIVKNNNNNYQANEGVNPPTAYL